MTFARRVLHRPGMLRVAGLDLLPVQMVWVFDPETRKSLGTISCVSGWTFRVSVWGPHGLEDAGEFAGRPAALAFLRQQATNLQEDGTPCTSTSPAT